MIPLCYRLKKGQRYAIKYISKAISPINSGFLIYNLKKYKEKVKIVMISS